MKKHKIQSDFFDVRNIIIDSHFEDADENIEKFLVKDLNDLSGFSADADIIFVISSL